MIRSPRFGRPSIEVERRPDGVLVLRSREPLYQHPRHLGLLLRDRAEREPRGFDALLPFFESDEELARGFFQDLDLLFYAAAALPRPTWDRLVRVAQRVREEPVPFVSAWGATETSPLVTQVLSPLDEPGNIGVPVPGASLKLVPNGLKLEIRVKGPQLTPGYFKAGGAAVDRRRRDYRQGLHQSARRARPARGARGGAV